jgi:Ca2+-binding EF-hand superfamily protein
MGAAASANDSLTQKQTLLNFEHDGFSASFSKIDVDGSGEIDKAEFSEAAKELGVIADPAEIDALFLKCVSQMPHTNNESIHIYAHRTVSALVAPTRVECFHRPTNECLPRGWRRAIASSSSRSRRGASLPSIALVRSLALSSSCSTPCRAHTRALPRFDSDNSGTISNAEFLLFVREMVEKENLSVETPDDTSTIMPLLGPQESGSGFKRAMAVLAVNPDAASDTCCFFHMSVPAGVGGRSHPRMSRRRKPRHALMRPTPPLPPQPTGQACRNSSCPRAERCDQSSAETVSSNDGQTSSSYVMLLWYSTKFAIGFQN